LFFQIAFDEATKADKSQLIRPFMVTHFLNSNTVLEAKKLLGAASEGIQLSEEDWARVRDYLMVRLAIDQFRRSGDICKLTRKRFEGASDLPGGGCRLLVRHKLTYFPFLINKEKVYVYAIYLHPFTLSATVRRSQDCTTWQKGLPEPRW